MIDFTASFNVGILSAEKADANKAEISTVFADLNEQLNVPSDGKIKISIVKFYEPTNILRVSLLEPRKYYFSIAAENPRAEESSTRELAKWSMDRSGYPCKITLGTDEIYCEDKEALEYGLSQVLQDPVVGDTLHKLMLLPVKQELEEDNSPEEGA